jgi:hypothetical protein
MDGQNERVEHVLEQYLRAMIKEIGLPTIWTISYDWPSKFNCISIIFFKSTKIQQVFHILILKPFHELTFMGYIFGHLC